MVAKKLFIVVFLVTTCLWSQSNVEFGVKNGLDQSALVYGYYNNYNSNFKLSTHVGIFAKFPIAKNIYIQPELILAHRIMKETSNFVGLSGYEGVSAAKGNFKVIITKNVVELPIIIGVAFNEKWNLQAGLQGGYLINSSIISPNEYVSTISLDVRNNSFSKFQVGLAAGAEYHWNSKWISQARVYYNLSEYFRTTKKLENGEKFTHNDLVFQLSVGYILF